MKILILGAGLVGSPIALDLAADKTFKVCAADMDETALHWLQSKADLAVVKADLRDPQNVQQLAAQCDLAISAVPGHMGFQVLKNLIQAKKPVVDIAFFPENPFDLDAEAHKQGVTAIVDCGVAPGMSHILAAHASKQMDKAEEVLIYVGGLPEIREWPYEYKAVFSPIDVIEEYTLPARYMENGCLITRPALSDVELIDFPGIGTLEAFNSDGLRTLLHTQKTPNMKEKTLRYPGHCEKMAVLRDSGFFSKEPITIRGNTIRPLDFTAQLLFPKWKLQEGEKDITVMQVKVKGMLQGRPACINYSLLDRLDVQTGIHSMARTTGYTATTAARMLAAGLYKTIGISAPEFIAREPGCVDFMLKDLARHGVVYRQSIL